jgi:hypothetical protein
VTKALPWSPCFFVRQMSKTVMSLNREVEQVVTQTTAAVRADEAKVGEMARDLEDEHRTIAQLKEQVRLEYIAH